LFFDITKMKEGNKKKYG